MHFASALLKTLVRVSIVPSLSACGLTPFARMHLAKVAMLRLGLGVVVGGDGGPASGVKGRALSPHFFLAALSLSLVSLARDFAAPLPCPSPADDWALSGLDLGRVAPYLSIQARKAFR
jgi:hypothetical protein